MGSFSIRSQIPIILKCIRVHNDYFTFLKWVIHLKFTHFYSIILLLYSIADGKKKKKFVWFFFFVQMEKAPVWQWDAFSLHTATRTLKKILTEKN